MPLCGFNQEMLEGINLFHKGLVEHGIINRSEKLGQSTDRIIEKELVDMNRFLQETHKIEDVEIRETVEALTRYASAFYKLVKKNNVENYFKLISYINNLYFNMDNKYYSELEGKTDDMKQLAIYLNNFKEEENATKRI